MTASKAADTNYLSASSSATTVTLGAANQAALVVSNVSGTYGTGLTLSTSGGSGSGAVSYVVTNGTATGCAISASVLSATSAGTCLVTATKAADSNYNAASSVLKTVTFAKASQSALTVTSTSATYGDSLQLAYSGGSGTGAVTFTIAASGTASGCSINSGVLTALSAGTCIVKVSVAGDANYLVATSANTTVTFAQAAQTALVITSTSGTFGSALALTTSGGSGTGTVTFTVANGTATGCAIASGKLSATSTGTCFVTATKAANANYLAYTSAATEVTIAASSQAALTVTSVTATYNTPLTLTTSGGSGTGAVTFDVDNGTANGCVVVNGVLTSTSAGTCLVTAQKSGDANYLNASSSQTTVTVNPAAQAAITVTTTTATYDTPMWVQYSGGSSTSDPIVTVANGTATGCAVDATTFDLTSTSAGTCFVTITLPADANYLVASSAKTTVTVGKAPQTPPTLTSTTGTYLTSLTLTATGGESTGAYSYSVSAGGTASGCAIASGRLTSTSAGTCLVVVTKATNTSYLAISSDPTLVTLNTAPQAALKVTSTSSTYGTPLTLTTSGGSGTGSVTYTVVNGTATGCTLTSGVLTTTSAGTCFVTATKAADTNFNSVSSSATTVTIAKATQTALVLTSTSGKVGSALLLTYSGGSGTGAVSFSIVAGGTASGAKINKSVGNAWYLTVTGAGTVNIAVKQATDSNYLAAQSANTAVTFDK